MKLHNIISKTSKKKYIIYTRKHKKCTFSRLIPNCTSTKVRLGEVRLKASLTHTHMCVLACVPACDYVLTNVSFLCPLAAFVKYA